MQKMSSFESVSSDGDICQSMCDNENDPYYESNGQHYYTQLYPADVSQTGNRILTDDSYWEDGSPCSSSEMEQMECSPKNYIANGENNNQSSPYHHHYTTQIYCSSQYEKNGYYCDDSYYGATTTTTNPNQVVRVIKRRTTANKKERRRTQSINSAYSCLRDRIPNVPSDTKLSKIKTLRLATSYISYLINVLDGEQEPSGFRAELVPSSRKINAERRAIIKNELQNSTLLESHTNPSSLRKKGRTGWPQAVWANMVK